MEPALLACSILSMNAVLVTFVVEEPIKLGGWNDIDICSPN